MNVTLTAFDRELFECLSSSEWKSGIELSREIGRIRKEKRRRRIAFALFSFIDKDFAEEMVLNANSGSLYISLYKFESLKWIESRWRNDSQEKIAARGGYRAREYRLRESGMRIRASVAREEPDNADWSLAPTRC